MPDCRIRIASPLRSYTGGAAELTAPASAKGTSLRTVLAELDARYPGIRFRMIDEQDSIRPHIRLFVNGNEALQLDAVVTPGSTVHLICALSGG